MGKLQSAMLIDRKVIATGTYELTFDMLNATKPVIPGQFLHIKIPNRNDLLLRRPISVNTVDKIKGTITLVIQAKGQGTTDLCNMTKNSVVDVVGPLGRGFMVSNKVKRAAIVGGGVGVAPLRYIIENNKKVNFDSYLGFRSRSYAYQTDIFDSISNMYLYSDDGSIGKKGFVTEALARNIRDINYDVIYACGPMPMFRALYDVVSATDTPCYVSMEERMGCGIGACKVCVCKIKSSKDTYDHLSVCQDGPVFDIREVVLS